MAMEKCFNLPLKANRDRSGLVLNVIERCFEHEIVGNDVNIEDLAVVTVYKAAITAVGKKRR